MIRRVLRFGLVIAIVPFLLGADTIALNTATGNPGGQAQKLEEDGNYTVDPANMLLNVNANAKLVVNGQLTQLPASLGQDQQGNLTWTATLSLAAGNYDCYGILYTKNNRGVLNRTQSNIIQNVNVQ